MYQLKNAVESSKFSEKRTSQNETLILNTAFKVPVVPPMLRETSAFKSSLSAQKSF